MASLNLDLDYFEHPKTMALVDLLGADADVLPIRLWCYCGKFHKATGDVLGSTAVKKLECRIGWRGPAGQCLKALVAVGFLDVIPDGYRVHDWLEHSGHIAVFHEKAKVAAKARWEKARPPPKPPDAPSNAPSNACSNAPAGLGCAVQDIAKPSASISLGALWVFHLARKKNRLKADDPDDAQGVFDELCRVHGFTEAALTVEIERPGRDRSEYLWQLKDRLLVGRNGGKPKSKLQELREKVEARRERG